MTRAVYLSKDEWTPEPELQRWPPPREVLPLYRVPLFWRLFLPLSLAVFLFCTNKVAVEQEYITRFGKPLEGIVKEKSFEYSNDNYQISILDKYGMNFELSPYIHLYTIRTRFSRHYCTLKARWRHPDHHTALCTNRPLIHNPLGNQTYNQPTRVVRIRESQQR